MMRSILCGLPAVCSALLLSHQEASAQTSAAAYTTGTRYDAVGRVTGTIAPDPDGVGPLKYAAVRNNYDAAGRLTKVESGELSSWKSEAIAPANWGADFTVLKFVTTSYDALDRKILEQASSGGTTYTVTQYSYDILGRLECTAVRMSNASLPASACTPGPVGPHGGDRITRNVYDAVGQLLQVREGVGTPIEAAEATYSYTLTGQKEYVIDGEGNRARLTYDAFDRQERWTFPSTARPAGFDGSTPTTALATAGAFNASDYEQYGYDNNGNRTSLRKRDGSVLTYNYDNLDRMTVKIVPARAGLTAAQTRDVYFDYDVDGHMTKARFDGIGGDGVTNVYNGFGELASSNISMPALSRTLSYTYDREGNRTRITHPDGAYFSTTFDGLNRAANASWTVGGGNSTPFMILSYNSRGLRSDINRANSATGYGYDPVSRLSAMNQRFAAGAGNANLTFDRNPAGQIVSESRDNDDYGWTGAVALNRNYTTNGLNQYTAAGPASFTYDANGNLTSDGSNGFLYDVENRLVSASGAKTASLIYDPMGRLFQVVGPSTNTRFLYDGDELVTEYDSSGAIVWRYYFGADVDEPILADPGGALACSNGTRFLHRNHQGSIVALADCWGSRVNVNSYDEYGIPAASNQGRFQYTGQAWIPELGMYYYKARLYSPTLGRFLQTDPIGYDDQVNLYAYVGNDPVNMVDPEGTSGTNEASNSCSRIGSTSCSGSYATGDQLMRSGSSQSLPRSARMLDGDTAMTRSMSRDAYDYFEGQASKEEVSDRNNARAVGTAAAGTALVGGIVAMESGAASAVAAKTGQALITVARRTFGKGGWANNNRFVRTGQGFKETGRIGRKPVGIDVFRISIGRKKPFDIFGYKIRIHKHIDLGTWPW